MPDSACRIDCEFREPVSSFCTVYLAAFNLDLQRTQGNCKDCYKGESNEAAEIGDESIEIEPMLEGREVQSWKGTIEGE